MKDGSTSDVGFFERFPKFVADGTVGVVGNRLQYRYRAIIDNQRYAFPGARILDLASHDGRWSLAALDAGARHVVGIEGRPHLAEKSREILAGYGFGQDRFKVIIGDCLEVLDELEPDEFDLILCLGFFYHTMQHFRLLTQIRRLAPRLVILDSQLSTEAGPRIQMDLEDSTYDGTSLPTTPNRPEALAGVPTIDALGMMLEHLDFFSEFVDWESLDLPDWKGVGDYRNGKRFTVLLRPLGGAA